MTVKPKLLQSTASAESFGVLLRTIFELRKKSLEFANNGEYALAITLLRKSFSFPQASELHSSKQLALATLWDAIEKHWRRDLEVGLQLQFKLISDACAKKLADAERDDFVLAILQEVATDIAKTMGNAHLIGSFFQTLCRLCDPTNKEIPDSALVEIQSAFE